MNIFMIIFFLFEAVIGLASSAYILVSLFVVLGYKIRVMLNENSWLRTLAYEESLW